MFLRSVQFREDDIVLLRPADPHAFTEEESWVGGLQEASVLILSGISVVSFSSLHAPAGCWSCPLVWNLGVVGPLSG